MSVFDYANVHLRHKGLPDGYVVRVVASQAGLVPSDTLMGLQASHTLAQVEAEERARLAAAEDSPRRAPSQWGTRQNAALTAVTFEEEDE